MSIVFMYVRTYVPDRMTEVLRFFFECQLYTVELPHDSLLFGTYVRTYINTILIYFCYFKLYLSLILFCFIMLYFIIL